MAGNQAFYRLRRFAVQYAAHLLDQRQGRVLYITGDINPTIEGLRITGGSAVGLGGLPEFERRLSHLCLITLAISPDLW